MLFGAPAGPRFLVGADRSLAIVGPKAYGETALHSFFGTATGVEALLSGRLEGAGEDRALLRVNLGTGAGLDPRSVPLSGVSWSGPSTTFLA
jgi:hypothetical protein